MTSELFTAQLKVASSTASLTVQLIDANGRNVPFHPSGTATGALVVTDSWQNFEQLWLTAVRLVDPSVSDSDYREYIRRGVNRANPNKVGYGVVAIKPLIIRGITDSIPIQLRLSSVVDDAVKTYANGDVLRLGQVPHLLLDKPRGVYGRDRQITHVTAAELHAAQDMVVAAVAIPNFMRDIDAEGYLSKLALWDKSNTPQISAYDLVVDFWWSNVTLAAAGAAFAATDAEALFWLGGFTIESTEWKDVGGTGQRVLVAAGDHRNGIHLKPKAGTRDVYVSYYTDGTPTPASTSDLVANYSVIDA